MSINRSEAKRLIIKLTAFIGGIAINPPSNSLSQSIMRNIFLSTISSDLSERILIKNLKNQINMKS